MATPHIQSLTVLPAKGQSRVGFMGGYINSATSFFLTSMLLIFSFAFLCFSSCYKKPSEQYLWFYERKERGKVAQIAELIGNQHDSDFDWEID
jgi:hypothetical protein